MGDVRAERAEDELAGLMGDRDVGEIYEKTEIVVGHPHLGGEFAAYGASPMREALSGKLIHWSVPTRKYLWIDSFIILYVVQCHKERNMSVLLDSK